MVPASQSSDEVSFADTLFGFLEDIHVPSENSSNSGNDDDCDLDEDNDSFCTVEDYNKQKAFWEEQEQLLQATLSRTSSIETKVRQATKEALRELNASEMLCICQRPVVAKRCRTCLQREICDRFLNLGYKCAICKSKWRSLLPGEHTYLEVLGKSSNDKREVKVVIELNFRAEFEMARANEEYNRLIRRLPEVYVGKAERLRVSVKIMCSAAKQCMKEKNMHLGPWRKHKYMEAKWFGTCDRSTVEPLPTLCSPRPPRPKASMLTFDLLENISGLHCTAVEVV